MNYLGIDIAQKNHQGTLIGDDGKVIRKGIAIANTLDGFNELLATLRALRVTPETVRIGFEATGGLWENLYTFLEQHNFTPILLNPFQTRKFHDALMKKAKTDTIDALVIAQLLRTNHYATSYVPSEQVQPLRDLTKLRFKLVQDRKNYQRQVVALLNVVFPEYKTTFLRHPFSKTGMKILKKYPTARHFKNVTVKQIRHLTNTIQGVQITDAAMQILLDTARKSSYSGKSYETRGLAFTILLDQIQTLEHSIESIETQLSEILCPEENSDKAPGHNLFTIPGVGLIGIAAVIGAVGLRGEAFATGTQYIGHIGFYPRISESGESRRTPVIATKGPNHLRWIHYMLAVAAVKYNSDMNKLYHDKISQGKSEKNALIFISKKVALMMLSMLKSGQNYNPQRVFVPIATT